jgi:hypothetical protein
MTYTALRVVEAGVVLYEHHEHRLAPAGVAVLDAYREFARTAAPGVYSLHVVEGALRITPRGESRLTDGMPVRYAVSPIAQLRGPLPKVVSPNGYDAVRVPGVATLLTSADGAEIYESCVAAVVAWNGRRLVLPPNDRPRVASVAEAALGAAADVIEAPLMTVSRWPLALVNAVKGLCLPMIEGRDPFPTLPRETITQLFVARTRRY